MITVPKESEVKVSGAIPEPDINADIKYLFGDGHVTGHSMKTVMSEIYLTPGLCEDNNPDHVITDWKTNNSFKRFLKKYKPMSYSGLMEGDKKDD